MGKGPWPVHVGSGYLLTVSDDPRLLYQDILVGLATERGINNGQPSLHARCLAACRPQSGETVVHIGAGTGYYTAILATLVGPTGRVTAYEIEPDLAEAARINLERWPTVDVRGASACEAELPTADVIYVSAGATHPLASWLDALNLGGRLLVPLTTNEGPGLVLQVTRCGPSSYAASAVTAASFIPCIGARDDRSSAGLKSALATRSLAGVRSLVRDAPVDGSVWCAGSGWWLSCAEPAEHA